MSGTAFGVAIALGACLLFQIQFLLAKLILPWFGGSPSVWSTSLVVFQVLLLAGYAYAHALAALPRRAQMLRHLLVVADRARAAGVAHTRVAVTGHAGRRVEAGPRRVAGRDRSSLLLTGAIGLPFLLLASTSPLLQRWYADRYPGRSPYRLYALSNARLAGRASCRIPGSSSRTSTCSSRGAGGPPPTSCSPSPCWRACGRCGTCRRVGESADVGRRETAPLGGGDGQLGQPARPARATTTCMWLLLAAVPAALLQATTTKITQDIAAVPFLWMVPLAIYLLTFIVAFEYAAPLPPRPG